MKTETEAARMILAHRGSQLMQIAGLPLIRVPPVRLSPSRLFTMKFPQLPLAAAAACLLLVATQLQARSGEYAAILTQRDRALSEIVRQLEARQKPGAADDHVVLAARSALLAFRRDAAETREAKIEQQSHLVALQEERLAKVKGSAVADPLDVLRATDSLLEAKQRLEELRMTQAH